ncbi:uncharacterized protein LOC107500100 isoform X2 [Rousettus aegyptiacus]|uniref:uncharacterized protein LOC107500100 isoform X2 n=1 Tax=Rousettus aegyptiacus TaxID=9407 RepID=UPI0007883DAC|nr:uncharacterized protein LOC107500100 isoform X2 [Rousettus aegyptiacus]
MCVGRELLRDVPLTRAEVPSQLPFIRWASANHHCSCKVGRGVNYLMSGTGRRNQAWIALPLLLSFFRESATGREHISCMQILFKKSIGKTPFMKTPGRQFLHKTRSYRFRMALPLFSYPRLTCPSRATHFRGLLPGCPLAILFPTRRKDCKVTEVSPSRECPCFQGQHRTSTSSIFLWADYTAALPKQRSDEFHEQASF